MNKKIIIKNIAFIFNIFFLVFLTVLNTLTLDLKNYTEKYEKYNIEKRTDLKEVEATKIINYTIDYIYYGNEFDNIYKYYNDYELEHLIDIREIFSIIKKIQVISFIVLLIQIRFLLKSYNRYIYLYCLKKTLIINYIFILIILCLSLINFKKYFILLHFVLFENNYWILNPQTDLLIQLMPERLFFDILIKLILIYISIILTIQLFVFLLDKKLKLGYNLDEWKTKS